MNGAQPRSPSFSRSPSHRRIVGMEALLTSLKRAPKRIFSKGLFRILMSFTNKPRFDGFYVNNRAVIVSGCPFAKTMFYASSISPPRSISVGSGDVARDPLAPPPSLPWRENDTDGGRRAADERTRTDRRTDGRQRWVARAAAAPHTQCVLTE